MAYKCVIIIGSKWTIIIIYNCYIFELNLSIHSEYKFLGCATTAFSERYISRNIIALPY